MADRRQRFENEKHEYHDPRLLLGCWFDERARREADFREFVDLYKRGELPVQKLEMYVKTLTTEAKCTQSLDGRLLNGCTVGLGWRCSQTFLSVLPKSVLPDGCFQQPCLATGAERPSKEALPARSAIQIFREDQRVPDNIPLMHGECLVFSLAGSPSQLFLNKDSSDPMPFRNINWVERSTGHSLWKTSGTGLYIVVNSPVVVQHVTSGQRLTLDKSPIQSLIGVERAVIGTFEPQEPDTWRFVAPCQLLLSDSERRHLRCRNVWEILNERY